MSRLGCFIVYGVLSAALAILKKAAEFAEKQAFPHDPPVPS